MQRRKMLLAVVLILTIVLTITWGLNAENKAKAQSTDVPNSLTPVASYGFVGTWVADKTCKALFNPENPFLGIQFTTFQKSSYDVVADNEGVWKWGNYIRIYDLHQTFESGWVPISCGHWGN